MRTMRMSLFCVVLAAALAWGPAGSARADLEDVVPADALLVLKVREPYGRLERFLDGPLFARLEDSLAMPQLGHAVQQIKTAIEETERAHGVDVGAVLNDILGREAALVAFPGDQGVFLTEGWSAPALKAAVAEFLRIEEAFGNVQNTYSVDYEGVSVQTVVLQNKAKDRHHALLGNVLAVSEDLSALRKVIDVQKGKAAALSASAQYREARALVDRGAVVSAYVDLARALPQALQAGVGGAPRQLRNPVRRLLRAHLDEILPHLRYAVLSATEDDGLRARLTVKYGEEGLPAFLQSVLPEAGSRLDVLDLAPPSAALVAARSVDFRALWDATLRKLEQANPEAAREAQNKLQQPVSVLGGVNSLEQLFDEIGHQVALFVLPASRAGNPPELALAVELRETAHIPVALQTLLGTAAVMASVEGKARALLESTDYQGVTMTTVRISKPAEWAKVSPTLCVVKGNLVMTTTAEAAKQVIAASRSRAATADDLEGTVYAAGWVNVPQLKLMLERHNDFLVRRAVEEDGKPEQQARQEIAALREILSLVEVFEATSAFGPDRTDHVLKVRFTADQR